MSISYLTIVNDDNWVLVNSAQGLFASVVLDCNGLLKLGFLGGEYPGRRMRFRRWHLGGYYGLFYRGGCHLFGCVALLVQGSGNTKAEVS